MSNFHDIAYYRQRTRNRVWEAVIKALDRAHDLHGTRRKDIADFLTVPPSQVSRWLSGPGNWEIDTVSDLLLSAGAEMDFVPVRFDERAPKNEFHLLNAGSGTSGGTSDIGFVLKPAANDDRRFLELASS